MKLIDYGQEFISSNAISRIYMKEVHNGYGAGSTYVLTIELLDGKSYSLFKGSRIDCRAEMLTLITKLGVDIVWLK